MRSLPTLVFVGTSLVGCGPDPLIALEARGFLATEKTELRAHVYEEHDHGSVDGVHGFDVQARTPAGEVVTLEEVFGELDGTYVAVASGIADSYTFYVDGKEYRFESPQQYTATLTLGSEPRIDWDPPTGDGELTRVSFSIGTSSGSIGPAPDHAALLGLAPGNTHFVVSRERRPPPGADGDKWTPHGFVSFKREFDAVIE